MDRDDIDAFLLAKKRDKLARALIVAASIVLTVGGLLLVAFDVTEPRVLTLLTSVVVGMAVGFAIHDRVSVPRTRLLDIIGKQVNRDAAALSYIASKRGGYEHTAQPDRREDTAPC